MPILTTSHVDTLNKLYEDRVIGDWTADESKDKTGYKSYTVWLKEESE